MLIDSTTRNLMGAELNTRINAGAGDSVLQILNSSNTVLAATIIVTSITGDDITDTDQTMADDASPVNGTAAKYRIVNGDDVVVIESNSVGTSGTELVISDINITSGVPVSFTSLTLSMANTSA